MGARWNSDYRNSMTGFYLTALFSILGALKTHYLFRRKTSFIRNLVVSFFGAILSGIFAIAVLHFTSGGLSGAFSRIFILIALSIGLFEWFSRLYFALEKKFTNEMDLKFDENRDLKTAAFYQKFDYISSLAAAKADSQLTEEFWVEVQSFRNKMFVRTSQGIITGNADVSGRFLNVTNGLRRTSDQPLNPTSRILMVGGSTTFCYESPDSHTISSNLQRMLGGANSMVRVENHGVGGATVMERSKYLQAIDLSNVDLVLVLFGDNEVGINLPRRWISNYPTQATVRKSYDIVVKLSDVSNLCKLLRARFGHLAFTDTEINEDRVKTVLDSCIELDRFLKLKGIQMQVFLQPNLYTRMNISSDDMSMRNIYPPHWNQIVLGTYKLFRTYFNDHEFFFDFSGIFDEELQFPYLDWAHVNSQGNFVIAKFFHNHLQNLKNSFKI